MSIRLDEVTGEWEPFFTGGVKCPRCQKDVIRAHRRHGIFSLIEPDGHALTLHREQLPGAGNALQVKASPRYRFHDCDANDG